MHICRPPRERLRACHKASVLIYAGIDEAGYGPMLGPLCVATSCSSSRMPRPATGRPLGASRTSSVEARASATPDRGRGQQALKGANRPGAPAAPRARRLSFLACRPDPMRKPRPRRRRDIVRRDRHGPARSGRHPRVRIEHGPAGGPRRRRPALDAADSTAGSRPPASGCSAARRSRRRRGLQPEARVRHGQSRDQPDAAIRLVAGSASWPPTRPVRDARIVCDRQGGRLPGVARDCFPDASVGSSASPPG